MVVVISIGFWDLHPREGGLGAKPSWMVLLSPSYGPKNWAIPSSELIEYPAIGFELKWIPLVLQDGDGIHMINIY